MFLNNLIRLFSGKRLRQIKSFKIDLQKAQEKVFWQLVEKGKNTEWGRKYDYLNIKNIDDFKRNVPISSYEDLEPYIKRMMRGEKNILCPGLVKWFAKSSGTTSSRSKFIPVTKESLNKIHFQGGRDTLYIYLKNFPKTKVLRGQYIIVAGSLDRAEDNRRIKVGDISAVMIKNMPFWVKLFIGPGIKTTLLKNWEEKLKKIVYKAHRKNITMIVGVPSWIALLIKKFLEIKNKKSILDIWPNFELLVHGGVSLEPYKKILNELLPRDRINYLEVYNASEGFFAIQDDPRNNDLLLMLDYGIFYEFLLIEELKAENPKTLLINEVELDKNYAIIISTNGGLSRYMIGDTIKFTSLYPHKIRITGRTKFFINVFGEEVIVENAEKAVSLACGQTSARVAEFTVGPKIFEEHNQGAHEWVIEFEREPENFEEFGRLIDQNLREINSDYDAKRQKDLLLIPPIFHFVSKGTFYNWLSGKGKLGGQNKIPRLSNDRKYLAEILKS